MIELLAGPIIRRVTENRVCVWLATESVAIFKLTILAADGTAIGCSDADASPEYRCQLGKNLYVYLLQATPDNATFPYDTLLYYRIDQIENGQNFAFDFKQMQLTYAGEPHPSFFLSSSLNGLLYGSCRKPHGLESFFSDHPESFIGKSFKRGQKSRSLENLLALNGKLELKDGLSRGDDELQATHADLEQRAALLIFGGDQIYADDVANSVLDMLKPHAAHLLGYEEQIPGLAVNPAQIPLGQRQELCIKQVGYSSTEAENHLLGFGEFAAMYLYVFGNAQNWQPDLSLETETSGRRQAVASFHQTLPKVRRLMANIPTYMLFDDHDVTDDWNITGAWYDRVRSLDAGRRVTANALAAYWAFQAWGNDPDNFDPDLRWIIENFLIDETQFIGDLAERFDLQMWKHRGWSFSIPTSPPIIALDSRTQRQPDNNYKPPRLIDRYGLDWLRVEWLKLKTRPTACQGWPIFIATTPVIGFEPVEFMQSTLNTIMGALESYEYVRIAEDVLGKQGFLQEKLVEKFDTEAWTSNLDGFVDLMSTLNDPERLGLAQCVFLSGDVHYAFSITASFQTGQQPPLSCLQLTSSALCNIPDGHNERALAKMEKLEDLKAGKFEHSAPPLWPWKRWKVKGQLHLAVTETPPGVAITPMCNLGLVKLDSAGVPILHQILTGDGKKIDYPLGKPTISS